MKSVLGVAVTFCMLLSGCKQADSHSESSQLNAEKKASVNARKPAAIQNELENTPEELLLTQALEFTPQCESEEAKKESFYDFYRQVYRWPEYLPEKIDPYRYSDMSDILAKFRAPWDYYSGIVSKAFYEQLLSAQPLPGIGVEFTISADKEALIVTDVHRHSSAANSGIKRGDKITAVRDQAIAYILEQQPSELPQPLLINAVKQLISEQQGATISWQNSDGVHTDSLDVGPFNAEGVMHQATFDTNTGKTGYLVFRQFLPVYQDDLDAAFATFKSENINKLILDLRENDGGFVETANHLSRLIAGHLLDDKVFLKYQHNDLLNQKLNVKKYQEELYRGPLDSELSLNELIVLTSNKTCSSSELLINSLQAYSDEIKVTTVGDKTCGKPVGMYPTYFCDSVLFLLNVEFANARDQADFLEVGMTPNCHVEQVAPLQWGSEEDPLLKEALHVAETGRCS
ncbi:S41 family peptidase [Pseudoalteromonas viridis]|uniref:Tail specific protease domain-containing protein n=1 Tax=Pseudoalteromonas viridis TaxID=339617 RepID=A0ABX7VA72_9GAMM|nr:S41 family peptidase [Pseudoalteromonas viridis]QTL36676.1 hypothetical protein J5X90_06490 [Pseudoalteromonas viridis]